MSLVFASLSISLDGFAAGPNVGLAHPMGEGGPRLHQWMFDGPTAADEALIQERFASGAVVLGRRTFDVGIGLWGDDGAFGLPCFVVTTRSATRVVRGATTFDFLTGGIQEAIAAAQAAAALRPVWVMGGALTVRNAIAAGLVHELHLSIVPVLLGRGTRLFDEVATSRELERLSVVETRGATHLRYRIG